MTLIKKGLALFLAALLILSLASCTSEESPETSDTGTASTSSGTDAPDASTDSEAVSDTEETTDEPEPVANEVLVCDQLNSRIILYDLDILDPGDDLDLAIVWTLEPNGNGYCADMKYREDTVFGDVILTAGGTSGIYAYPGKDVIWSTNNPGNNPHAVEILPDGDIVIANSTGATVRHFNTSILTEDPEAKVEYVDYELYGAHGVVYDPTYECLWALGNNDLVAYDIVGDFELSERDVYTMPEGNRSGHDLSADLTDTRYLYLTSITVLRFDKETGEFEEKFPQYAKLTHSYTTGFGNNKNNNFFSVWGGTDGEDEKWGKQSIGDWCSDVLHFYYWKSENFLYRQDYESSTSAFYKSRPFYGQYQ